MAKPGRNDPCPCGSGNKYKRCCLPKEEADEHARFARAAAEAAEAAAARKKEEQAAFDALICSARVRAQIRCFGRTGRF
jgi:hypothetical protein